MNPVEDIKAAYNASKELGWKENPILVPSELLKTAREISRDNHIHVIIKGVWKKENGDGKR